MYLQRETLKENVLQNESINSPYNFINDLKMNSVFIFIFKTSQYEEYEVDINFR